MGMYDTVLCRFPLPGLGVVEAEFQTKDTPAQFLDVYEIREDGTLWRQDYDTVDRSDPRASGLGRIVGLAARENLRWVREYLSGRIRFYTGRNGNWLEFEAEFRGGVLESLVRAEEPEGHGLGLSLDPSWVEQVRAEEREAAARIVEERALAYEAEGEDSLGLVLRTLALRIRRR